MANTQTKIDYWKMVVEDELLVPVLVLNENKKRFLQLTELFNNKQLEKDLFLFVKRNYISFMSLAVRRMIDADDQSYSLKGLLNDIQTNHTSVTKNWFLKQPPLAEEEGLYEGFFRENEYIGCSEIQSDIEELDKYTKPIKDRADKWEAHWDKKRTKLKNNPTFDDLYLAVETIIKIYKKYYYLLTQSSISLD